MKPNNIRRLANFIEKHEEYEFNMGSPENPERCGSAGCIGGFAAALWPDDVGGYGVNTWNSDELQKRLGISENLHEQLCFPTSQKAYTGSRAGAVRTLRHLAKTGKVKWS